MGVCSHVWWQEGPRTTLEAVSQPLPMFFVLFYIYECLCGCTMCAWYLLGSEEGLALPELELQMTVNQHTGAGNRTQVLIRQPMLLTSEPPLWPSPP